MSKRKNELANVLGAICGAATVIGVVFGIIKLLSPEQRCPTCDRVLEIVSGIQSVCPNCGGLFGR